MTGDHSISISPSFPPVLICKSRSWCESHHRRANAFSVFENVVTLLDITLSLSLPLSPSLLICKRGWWCESLLGNVITWLGITLSLSLALSPSLLICKSRSWCESHHRRTNAFKAGSRSRSASWSMTKLRITNWGSLHLPLLLICKSGWWCELHHRRANGCSVVGNVTM